MGLPRSRSGGLPTALLGLLCFVVGGCVQNVPVTPPPAPPPAPAAAAPATAEVRPPANREPRSPNPPPVPTLAPSPAAEPLETPPAAAGSSSLPAPLSLGQPVALAATAAPSVPRWILYGWYFHRLTVQQGAIPSGVHVQRVETLVLGLTEQQMAILEEVASDCDRIVEEQSAKFTKASGTGSGARLPRKDQLGKIAAEIIGAVGTHVADLRQRLGPALCDRLDAYVQRLYGSAGVGPQPVAGLRTAAAAPAVPAPPPGVPIQPTSPPVGVAAAAAVPPWILYGWYFQHVVYLDRLADQRGTTPMGDSLRRRDQLALGLTDPQAAILKEIAHDSNRVVEEQGANFDAASGAASPARRTGKEQLGKIGETMIESIATHVAGLRAQWGADLSDRLDSFIRRLYNPVSSAMPIGLVPAPPPGFPVSTSAGTPGGYVAGAPVPRAPSPPPTPNPTPAPTVAKPEEDAASVTVLAAEPGSASPLYVGTARGIYANTSSSDTWAFCGGPLANAAISAVVIGSGNTPAAFAATDGDGVFQSTDRGKTWTAMNDGLSNRSVSSLLLEDAGSGTSRLYAGTNEGVFRSTPGGAKWEPVSTGMAESAITALGGSGQGAAYAGSQSGKLFKTTDGGANWSEEGVVPWSGPVRAIVSAGSTVYVAAENGLFKKSDGDRTWSAADAGLPTVNLTALVISPDKSLYAVIREGIWKSDNGGASWNLVSETLPSAFAVPGSGSALYAGVRGTVLKSTDSGRSWKTTPLRRPAAP